MVETTKPIYRGFLIVPTDPIPAIPGWEAYAVTWVHEDYDGAEDNRIGCCRDDDAARAAIDEWYDENDCPSEWIMVFDGDGPACGEFAYCADLIELFEQFGFDVIEGYDTTEGYDA